MNDLDKLEQIAQMLYNADHDKQFRKGIEFVDFGTHSEVRLGYLNKAKVIEEYVKDRESVAYTHGLLSFEAHQQDIIKARIETAEKIKGNCESEAERIWIMHYIVEIKKGSLNE